MRDRGGNYLGDLLRDSLDLGCIAPLDHDPDHRFGARRAQQQASATVQFALGGGHRVADRFDRFEVHALGQGHVEQYLGEALHSTAQDMQGLAGFLHVGQHLQGGDDTVAGGGSIQADQVARGFAAEDPAALLQALQNEPVKLPAARRDWVIT